VGEVAVGKFPNWLAFTPDGKTLFVSNTESNTVTAIDVPTRSVRATIAVGRAPKRLIVVPRAHGARNGSMSDVLRALYSSEINARMANAAALEYPESAFAKWWKAR
jgi:YVTN family beta-propeller protein